MSLTPSSTHPIAIMVPAIMAPKPFATAASMPRLVPADATRRTLRALREAGRR
jgi:hypothetical protein